MFKRWPSLFLVSMVISCAGIPSFVPILHRSHFTNTKWAHIPKLEISFLALTWTRKIKSGHNFAHVMTTQLSWHVQICDWTGSSELSLKQKEISYFFNYEFINDVWDGSRMPPVGYMGRYRAPPLSTYSSPDTYKINHIFKLDRTQHNSM